MKLQYAAITSAIALLMTANGFGQGRSSPSEQQRLKSPRAQESSMQKSKNKQTISGEIEAFRHIAFKNKSGAPNISSLIRLQMEDGRSVIVDLGSKSKLDHLNLEQGDQIRISGQYATIAGQNVFQADRLQVNGRTTTVQRDSQQSFGQMAQQQSGGEQMRFTGTIQGFKHVDARDSKDQQRQEQTLVQLKLENGRTLAANLGPKSRLEKLNLEKGDRIRVQGHRGTFDKQPVLLVDRLKRLDQDQQTSQQGSQASQSREFTLRGDVKGYQVWSIGTGEDQAVLLNLRLEDGRSVIVDAGDYQPGELDLKNLNIGDQVTIKGKRISTGDQQILRADNISFNEPMGAERPQGKQSKESQKAQKSPDSQSQK